MESNVETPPPLPTTEPPPRPVEEDDEEEDDGDVEGADNDVPEEPNEFDDPSQPIGKQYVPGGSLNDYFFPAAPRWTVGNALARILTKVKNNPSNSMSIQKFVKDSCKGNLRQYFTDIRDSLGRGDNVVMAEIAYLSFVQLTKGDKPLLNFFVPRNRPRTRAAAVSDEGYAFKDYRVQVTTYGFELMNARMIMPGEDEAGGGASAGDDEPPQKRQRRGSASTSQRRFQPNTMQLPLSVAASQPGFVPRITEQEQEAAQNMLLFVKASTDGFLATIHHIRMDNDALRKENLALKFVNDALIEDVRAVKVQLVQAGLLDPQLAEPLASHPQLGSPTLAHSQSELGGSYQPPMNDETGADAQSNQQ